ncbi:uncharacterized protein LOC118746249 isoform X2 [Rhagoletis pomonella]|uniref:uncharacterized protein LOC118746249 isoform X2 n=1 Tax=Rhagoletis pomonella TaxID=28610 RepID=UPI00177EA770|nr:uncharacterized protein LOC118746249 isoform X2 [Rhagoletis pomonella]
MESEEVFENVFYAIGGEVINITPASGEVINLTSGSGEVINTITPNSFLSEEENDDHKLKALLKGFAAQVTYRSLKFLRKEDLKEAIPPLGLRVEFREKLIGWKKQEFDIDDDTISADSNVINWLNRPTTSNTSSSRSPVCRTYINKDLFTLLSNTARGTKILNFYKENNRLDNINRDEIIAILIEEICYGNISLKPSDFHSLVNEICSVFPSEVETKEYYYIPRTGKKNPSGKLFYKYVNCRKGKKGSHNIPHNEENNTQQCTEELNNSIISALKLSLSKESADWNEVLDKWAKTFSARQKDLKNLASSDFLKAWPKLADARAPELIKIDFDLLYPLKQDSLHSKWDHFKKNIVRFYETNINNDTCKQLFSLAKSLTNKDSQDYLLSILLTSVLQTSSRFTNNLGKRSKKITIIDAQESFILRIESINDYQRKIDEIVCKYYSCHLTIQPFLIVVGSVNDLNSFFIYFDSTLYKFSTFLESLDVCFKIFQVFSLSYPEGCELVWIFIQKYFFDITTKFDCKSSNVVSLINFLQNT